MTEKRFWYDFEDCTGAKIVDFKENKEYPLETIGDFRKIEKLLNEQHEQMQILKVGNGEMDDYLARLEEENKQLKQFIEKVFVLFDKEISRNEEAIEWGKEVGADSGSVGFYNHMLKRLKKELRE